MFRLTAGDLCGGVLDCGGGPASFVAEAGASGYRVVSVDPVYQFGGEEIRARFEASVESVMDQVRATPDEWSWTYHRDPDDLLATRRAALEKFLVDYGRGLREGRYVVGELPTLPFAADSFGIAVCSHLLFLYSDLLSAEFHIQAMLELCRIASEVRVFPLVTLRRETSPHVETVRGSLRDEGWQSEIVPVDYELQRGGNEMLRVSKV